MRVAFKKAVRLPSRVTSVVRGRAQRTLELTSPPGILQHAESIAVKSAVGQSAGIVSFIWWNSHRTQRFAIAAMTAL